ncbi:membrane protein [Advenella kashmirensis W13003]|uniref:Membrane protein n=1 Tax=Advenella kashmirensis W13003 TaxID=1424334 RepID=V8QU84_9BURK|nr:EamA family transporter [Advenella kashmirensis]ETF02880.1 membrane protein [Advenella kashmirensis W13003]
MPLRHWLAALLVVLLWGLNFVVIKFGVDAFPPLLLGALRFALVAFPAILFIPRPVIPLKLLLLFGLTLCFGQFAFLFSAIALGMPAGLASLVLQSQAFFSVLIAALLLNEKVRVHSIIAMIVAALGLGIIEMGADIAQPVPLFAFMLTLCAAFSWGCGNIVIKKAGPAVNMFSLLTWGAVFPAFLFLLASWLIEGPQLIMHSVSNLSWMGVGSVMYLAYAASFIGYYLWGRLLAQHPVSLVTPMSLLIPVIGLLSAELVLHETLSTVQWLGSAVVVIGLGINIFGGKLLRFLRVTPPNTHRRINQATDRRR